MLSLKKVFRDAWFTRARLVVMLAALVTGLVGWGSLVRARSVLLREAPRNYMDSQPAAILLDMEAVSEEALAAVRAMSGVQAATRRARLEGRFALPGTDEKRRAVVFVIDDFEHMPIARVFPQSGAWPPTAGTVLLERSSLVVLGDESPTVVHLDLPSGARASIPVSGIAHEPALAPASTEQAIYVYVRAEDLEAWGQPVTFSELRYSPTSDLDDVAALEQSAREVSQFLQSAGLGHVTALRIPPPGRHPHQSQMTTVLTLFVLFAGLTLLLSSLLTASLIDSLMARQVREIAVLKTLGASRARLLSTYILAVLVLALIALVLSWWPSSLGADLMARSITRLLNFDLLDAKPSWLAVAFQVTVALSVPLAVTLPVLRRATRRSVTQALSDHGTDGSGFGTSRFEMAIAQLTRGGYFLRYALREALRRRRRFALAIAVLTVSGGIFLSAVNTSGAWRFLTARLTETRHYDFEMQVPRGSDIAGASLSTLPSVSKLEAWSRMDVGMGAGDQLPIQTTYPDGGHGAFRLYAVPKDSKLASFQIEQGRWLHDDVPNEIVINQVVPGAEAIVIGDPLVLSVEGRDHTFRVVGMVEEIGTGAGVYVSTRTFDTVVPGDHGATLLRIQARGDIDQAMKATDEALLAASVPVLSVAPLTLFQNAVAAHFEILVKSLMALAAIAAIVGALGLGAALSSNVAENLRELGVLRALGASRKQLRNLVVTQALLVSGISAITATALGLGLSWAIGNLIGQMSFQVPLPLVANGTALLGMVFGFFALGTVASLLPASQASRTTVARSLHSL